MNSHLSQLGPWLPLIVIGALVIFIFEIWMLVHVAINKNITDKARVWWIIGMVLIHPIVAIVYLFTDYRKRKQSLEA